MEKVMQIEDVVNGSVKLAVNLIEACDRTRVRRQRPKENSDVVHEYAEAYECGLITEPLDVFNEDGTQRYLIADGEHRLLALRRAKIKQVEVRLHKGDEVAALDFAIGCNQGYGLRRTKADKFHALCLIMETPTLKAKYRTDTDISEKIGVTTRTVAAYKANWRESVSGDQSARRAKEKARESAAKKTRTDLKTASDDEEFHHPEPAENKGKPKIARTKTPSSSRQLTPEQRKVSKQVRDSTKNTNGTLPIAEVHDFQRGIGLLASSRLDMEKFAASGKVDWSKVELAADVLWKLLEQR